MPHPPDTVTGRVKDIAVYPSVRPGGKSRYEVMFIQEGRDLANYIFDVWEYPTAPYRAAIFQRAKDLDRPITVTFVDIVGGYRQILELQMEGEHAPTE